MPSNTKLDWGEHFQIHDGRYPSSLAERFFSCYDAIFVIAIHVESPEIDNFDPVNLRLL